MAVESAWTHYARGRLPQRKEDPDAAMGAIQPRYEPNRNGLEMAEGSDGRKAVRRTWCRGPSLPVCVRMLGNDKENEDAKPDQSVRQNAQQSKHVKEQAWRFNKILKVHQYYCIYC